MIGQLAVDELFKCPASFTKFGQAHHARAAFERMKHTAQRCLRFQIIRCFRQGVQRYQAVRNHLSGFFKKDAFELQIIFKLLVKTPGHNFMNLQSFR